MPGTQRRLLLKGHTNWVVCLESSPDGTLPISGSGDGTARVSNVSTGKEIGRTRFKPNDYVW